MSLEALPAPAPDAQLGAHSDALGTAFALWAPRATRVELALVAPDRSQHNVDLERADDGVWSAWVEGVGDGAMYGYRVHGPWAPETGQRFNPAKLLMDPYARAYTGGVDYAGPISDHTIESDYLRDPTDSFLAVPLSVVVARTPPPPAVTRRPMAESVIYELHVKGYTRLHPLVPEHLRGTFAGLAHPAVIEHLVSTGVTAVELLPIHHFVSEPFVVGSGLANYWGYNTMGFFAPQESYGAVRAPGQQVSGFKEMVAALHEAGIEVILDVVYNHTGEGGHEGPTLSFRGIDHGGYYRLTPDNRNDYDVTGTGNSVDTSELGVQQMILDSLRYWVTEMGVDGFRFDLATTLIRDAKHHVDQEHQLKVAMQTDPVLQGVKLIAEPWDVGPYGYQVGAWGLDWSEWNDRFRGYVRDYWRGIANGVQELATRMSGSPDLYDHDGRNPEASVNFVTAHDGFTVRDLVSYDRKHNDANKEHNRDGTDDNRSWNCGVEGETEDPAILALRHRQVKNLMATMFLAFGTPMITAGDEFGRTQQGNNNAYCQDGPISWVDWGQFDAWGDVLSFTSALLALRAAHPVLRSATYHHHGDVLDSRGLPLGRPDLAWLNGYSGEMTQDDWHDTGRQTIGMYVSTEQEAFVSWLHAGAYPLEIVLPELPWGSAYRILLHTGEPDELPASDMVLVAGTVMTIPPRTVVVMQVDVPTRRPRTSRKAIAS
ncbi:MAG: glycogen debranching protein GlgX [Propionibacteriaceae bacterium]